MLTELANRFGSDKGTTVGAKHAYTLLYTLLFEGFRERPVRLLELGLARGGPEVGRNPNRLVPNVPSIQMWLDYFRDVHVTGFDISDFSQFVTERFKFVRGDLGATEDLAKLKEDGDTFDIIVDDGSHASYHQMLAFQELFPCVRKGGFYIIEDLHWQPPDYERILPKAPKARDFFAAAVRGNCLEAEGADRQKLENALAACASINLISGDTLDRLRWFYAREFGELTCLGGMGRGFKEAVGAIKSGRPGKVRRLFRRKLPKLVVIKKAEVVQVSR